MTKHTEGIGLVQSEIGHKIEGRVICSNADTSRLRDPQEFTPPLLCIGFILGRLSPGGARYLSAAHAYILTALSKSIRKGKAVLSPQSEGKG